MKKIALIGAGGKMGMRISKNLKDLNEYDVAYIEISEEGKVRLKELGISTEGEEVVPYADIVILAVPDTILGKVSEHIIPLVKTGGLVVTLDPACALAGVLAHRDNLNYFIAHPSHPSVFNWESTPEAQTDYFGGNMAKQTIVCALYKGAESAYDEGEALAKKMYAPVSKAFKITAEQMGILEPALVETLCSTMQVIVREALDVAIEKGVPEEAAREFLLGHMNIQLAVLYNQIPGAVFSDAANKAIIRGKPLLINKDWKQVFEPENIMEQIRDITT